MYLPYIWKIGVEAVESCCVSDKTLLQPSATAQQSASQPCTEHPPPSLSLSLCISVSLNLTRPQCQRHLLSPRLLPMPTACPATHSACLSGEPLLPVSLSAALHVLSLHLFFLQSPVCLLCSICLTVGQP